MSANPEPSTEAQTAAPRWQPVASVDRRVLGVLVEKAKTTPDTYPLSLNALVSGANQKNNRHPLTQYEAQHIEESLERLRHLGAVAAVQGAGRVEKYRHYLYDWLGVDKVELAVMAELLLRGPQTEGELRGRAARMDPIADLAALRPIVDALKSKGLVQSLSPEGRGQIVTHCLYPPDELARLRQRHGDGHEERPGAASTVDRRATAPPAAPRTVQEIAPRPPQSASVAATAPGGAELAALRREVDGLRSSVAALRAEMADLAAASQRNSDDLDRLRQSLGG